MEQWSNAARKKLYLHDCMYKLFPGGVTSQGFNYILFYSHAFTYNSFIQCLYSSTVSCDFSEHKRKHVPNPEAFYVSLLKGRDA